MPAARADVLPPTPGNDQDLRSSTALAKELPEAPASAAPKFGFSLGLGLFGATGNRGLLLQEANPMYDLAFYYRLTPQLSIDVEGSTVDDAYDTTVDNGGHVTVNFKHLEFGVRYYGDLHSLLPRIVPGFISPFAALGAGVYSMSKTSFEQNSSTPAETQLGMTVGAGLRFEVVQRLLSLELLGRWNSVSFSDTYTVAFLNSNNVPDQTGQFVSWNANLLVTF